MNVFSDHPRARKQRVLLLCIGLIVAMAGLSYASVPLYEIFCSVTGYGGTTQYSTATPSIGTRNLDIHFDANTAQGIAWDFHPVEPNVTVKLGEVKQIFYRAVNHDSVPITGISSFNVAPHAAAIYFNKQECFCFVEHTLQPGEEILMGVTFFVDPTLDQESQLRQLKQITLSYTFFPDSAFKRKATPTAQKTKADKT